MYVICTYIYTYTYHTEPLVAARCDQVNMPPDDSCVPATNFKNKNHLNFFINMPPDDNRVPSTNFKNKHQNTRVR